MHIAFLYNESSEDPANMAEDDVPDGSPLVESLGRLGHHVTPIACTLDLAAVQSALAAVQPDVAFNRVESLGGSDGLAAAIPLLLDVLQIPYTGCPSAAIVATANKIHVKQRLVEAGLPTPEWISGDLRFRIAECGLASRKRPRTTWCPRPECATTVLEPKFIIKSVYEHASFEMDDAAIVGTAPVAEIAALVGERSALYGRPFFAERFIEGREFNLSLIGQRPQVLPPAEIDFSAFPRGKPRIVGYQAKWNDASFEFTNTPRQFDFPPEDGPLLRRMSELAVRCWELFDLRGYARVDFRCDALVQPWILEINTNPCLSPASGFAAALEQAGIGFDRGIQQLLNAATCRVLLEPAAV